MNEIIKISMKLEVNKELKEVGIKFEQAIREDIEDLMSSKEIHMVRENLENICEIVSNAIRRDVEDVSNISDELNKKINACQTIEELFELALDAFLKNK